MPSPATGKELANPQKEVVPFSPQTVKILSKNQHSHFELATVRNLVTSDGHVVRAP